MGLVRSASQFHDGGSFVQGENNEERKDEAEGDPVLPRPASGLDHL
jgi:hypothetical protein